ncbi:PEP/pyruvate-binding domain-containing protein [Paracoccus sp. S1E-3]|uniref:PEP/pyruvate-binding domain-containing protein n=1 Tax=Paracoccus sp. S1E-3 TaxID=2756130 RepID=UPI0015EF2570|nr:PEP/pyruvate-binding domain-containing protein [Paracoccus sp. S1E-3]MBA4491768.1 phosphoenolpyruvate synthase [Paracoccus sp. S1E-3]
MRLVVPQHTAGDPAQVGGKAASLHRLAAAGFAPPDFIVIRAEAFTDGTPDPRLAEELAAAMAGLGPAPYAVRSSGRGEDGAEHSHAGQFDTRLNVAAADVIAAAAAVWASGFTDGIRTYRARRSGGAAEAPAIIVQRMIDARAAGVAFSANPVSGLRGEVMISAVAGLGERLVAGEVDGEPWVFGAAVTAPARPAVLTAQQAAAIADLARRAEAAFGAPQDIEWAIDADGLHILQSRPITTPLRPAPAADDTLTVFDNSNIIESYPGIVSPLTYSFAMHVYDRVYRAFVDLLGVPAATVADHAGIFANMLGRVDGRVYYNLGNWYRALALLPGFALNRGYMETMMGLSEPLPQALTASIGPPPAQGFARVTEYLRVARVGAGLLWQAAWLPRTRARFYARLNAALGSDLDLATAGPVALAAQFRRIEADLLDRWDAPLVNDFLCMIGFGASRRMLERWLGPQGLALHNDVMIGQGDIISAEPARRIARMGEMVRAAGLTAALETQGVTALNGHPEIVAELDAYLQKFGDRCTEELKLESIPLMQDPAPLLAAIAASAAQGPRSPLPSGEADWRALFPKNPLRRRVARALTNWARARVRDRENLRFERTRIFGYARRVFLALGREFHARGLLDEPRDIFWLTTSEVLGAVEGFGLSPDLAAIARLRKAEDAVSSRRPDPPERIEIYGPAIAPVWTATATGAPPSDARVKMGTGCSAGRVTARARIIRDPRRESLAPGDILVARHTDPGWIAVFSNASAIVVERGSLLSHSAIVARELGIPCVVGLKGATDWITDGETLGVDGATGRVERLDA